MAELTDIQLDALREMGNIGAGNSATALSQLISETIKISVPSVRVVSLESVPDVLGGPEKQMYVVYLEVSRELQGTMLTIFSSETAEFLTRKLLGQDTVDMKSEIAQSALREVGSILCGSYLSALSQVVNMSSVASVPALAFDMLGALLDFILIEIGQVADDVFLVEVELYVASTHLECSQLFLPKPESLTAVLASLGM